MQNLFILWSKVNCVIDMNANKVADTILSWNTDDELSDEEEIFSGAVRDEEEVSGVYGKGHPVAFLWSKRYDIPIFCKNMSRDYFLKILKYFRFDDKPNRVRGGPCADKFASI